MNAIIVYDTITGNTETCAKYICDIFVDRGYTVNLQDATHFHPTGFENYDLIVLGSPTYSLGELTEDFELFVQDMAGTNLSTKKAAVFGLGDSEDYPDDFCTSVDILENSLKDCKANLIVNSLKVDGDPEMCEDAIKTWAGEITDYAGN